MMKNGHRLDGLPTIRRARRRWLAIGIGGCVCVALTAFVVFSVWGTHSAEKSRREVLASESELLAREAGELLAQGDRYQAVQVALSALPDDVEGKDRPFVPAAQMALEEALGVYPQGGFWSACYSIYGMASDAVAYSEGGLVAVVTNDAALVIFDCQDGNERTRIDVSDMVQADPNESCEIRALFADDKILCLLDGVVAAFDVESGQSCWRMEMEGCGPDEGWAMSSDSHQLVVATCSGHVDNERWGLCLVDVATGDARTIGLDEFHSGGMGHVSACMAIDQSCEHVALGVDGSLALASLSDGSCWQATLAKSYVNDVQFYGDVIVTLSSASFASICVQGFDFNRKELWTYEDVCLNTFDSDGVLLANRACLCDCVRYEEGGDLQVFALLDGPLVGIDLRTGRATYRLLRDTPFVECAFTGERHSDGTVGGLMCAVTSGGEVLVRSPADDGIDDAATLYDTNLGPASSARLISGDGTLHLVLWSYAPARCRTYSYGAMGTLLGEERLGFFERDASFRWNGTESVVITADKVALLDSATLNPVLSVSRHLLEQIDSGEQPNVSFSSSNALYVYGDQVYEADERTEGTYVYRVDACDGSILSEYAVEDLRIGTLDDAGLTEHRLPTGKYCLILQGGKTVCVVDADTGAELLRVDVAGSVRKTFLFENTLLVFAVSSVYGDGGWSAYDLETGALLDLGVLGFAVSNEDESCIAGDEKNQRLVVGCSDGVARMFDVRDDTLVWETQAISTGLSGVFVGANGVLLQDEEGRLMLVSAEDGTVLKATSASVPALRAVTATGTTGMVVGCYVKPGYAQSVGLVVISMTEDEFGPMSHIRGGAFTNADASRIVIWDSTLKQMIITHRLSLVQLQEMAHVMARERPLSEAERLIYGVG